MKKKYILSFTEKKGETEIYKETPEEIRKIKDKYAEKYEKYGFTEDEILDGEVAAKYLLHERYGEQVKLTPFEEKRAIKVNREIAELEKKSHLREIAMRKRESKKK